LSNLAQFLGQQKSQCHTQGTQIGHQVKQIVENLPQNYTSIWCSVCDMRPSHLKLDEEKSYRFAKWFWPSIFSQFAKAGEVSPNMLAGHWTCHDLLRETKLSHYSLSLHNTSDLQGKGLNTKGKAFLSSKQAYLCTIIKLELQAMGVATTTIFQDSDSCNYFLNQAVDVEHAGTFPWWDWPWSNTKTKQQLVQHAFVGKQAWTSVFFLRVCQNYVASSDCPFLLESSSEIVRLKRAFIQAAGSGNSPVAILTC